MSYLIVRTEIQEIRTDELIFALSRGNRLRDEGDRPETRRETLVARDLPTALHLARALALTGPVRNGRHRIKVLRCND